MAGLSGVRRVPASARAAGVVLLACWTAVVVFASLDTEAAPKLLLR